MFSQKRVRWFVSIRQWFVMGAMLLASALSRGISPRYSWPIFYVSGGDFLCLGHWLRTWQPCAALHAHWRTPYAFSYLPVSLCSLYSLSEFHVFTISGDELHVQLTIPSWWRWFPLTVCGRDRSCTFLRLNFPAKNRILWTHFENTSRLLFKKFDLPAFKTESFSCKHRLELFPSLE